MNTDMVLFEKRAENIRIIFQFYSNLKEIFDKSKGDLEKESEMNRQTNNKKKKKDSKNSKKSLNYSQASGTETFLSINKFF